MDITPEELASIIDHTQLHADSSREEIQKLADEARRYGFGSVCVNPFWVPTVRECLRGTDIGVVCVIGFPLGQNRPESKFEEARSAVEEGATELDMVMNIGALKSQMFGVVESEIRQIADLGVTVKTIIEACYLLPEEKIMACELSMRAGASYIKTSTGFGTYGATREDVSLIRHVVGDRMKIKAAGGISSWEKARGLLEAGADRIGASKSIQILKEFKKAQ